MRHELPFKNIFYLSMLKEAETLNKDELMKNSIVSFGVLYRLWNDGAFDEYSDDHFLIHAINDDVEYFKNFFILHYIQITVVSVQYSSIDSFPCNFVVNLENRLRALVSAFGYDHIRRFVIDQLSAGKGQYDEKQFFEALSEIHLLSYFCQYGGMSAVAGDPMEYDTNGRIKVVLDPVKIVSSEYEPKLNGETNPEARFRFEDGTIFDIEVKTPRFSDDVELKKPCLMPGVLLDSDGRKKLKDFCKAKGIQAMLPNVSKMKDFLCSAAKKFQDPENEKHINLLCVNWTEAKIDKDGITEPLIILSNLTNGLLSDTDIAKKCQISQAAINRVSAVLLYKMELGVLLFSDFRYVFANGKARVVLNKFSKHLNTDAIHRITKLSCIYPEESGIDSLIYANDVCLYQKDSELLVAEKIVMDHMLS